MIDDRAAGLLGLLTMWRLALAFAVLFLVLAVAAVAAVGTRPRQIYAAPGTDRAAAAPAPDPMQR